MFIVSVGIVFAELMCIVCIGVHWYKRRIFPDLRGAKGMIESDHADVSYG